jgi:hypothetical protein
LYSFGGPLLTDFFALHLTLVGVSGWWKAPHYPFGGLECILVLQIGHATLGTRKKAVILQASSSITTLLT